MTPQYMQWITLTFLYVALWKIPLVIKESIHTPSVFKNYPILVYADINLCSGRSRGGCLNTPLKRNYFIFMENFQKKQEKLISNVVELTNRTPLCKFEPPIKKSWICPCCVNGNILFSISRGQLLMLRLSTFSLALYTLYLCMHLPSNGQNFYAALLHIWKTACFFVARVKVFIIIPEFSILRLTFHRKSASKYLI